MATDKKISQLSTVATPARTDILTVLDPTTNKKGTAADYLALTKDSDLQLTDITTNDVSIAKHGFAPKAPNDTTKFLRGDATWATPGSGLVLLEQHAANSSSTLDFTAFISSTYDEYLFEFINILPASDGALLWMRMGTGAGPTFDAGANYSFRYWRLAGATAVVSSAGDTKIILTAAADDDVLYGIVGQVRMYSPQSTSQRKMINGQLFFEQTAAGGFEETLPMGVYDSTTAVTGVRFLMSTGNITSGTIRAYGVAK